MKSSKSTFFLVLFMLSTNCVFAQIDLQWNFTNYGADNGSIGSNMYSYPNGDVFVSGANDGGDLDPGPGFNNSGTPDGNYFFARYTPTGDLVYARPRYYSGPPGFSYASRDAMDADGNFYFIFSGPAGTFDFDTTQGPGFGELTLTNQSHGLVKLDANGDYSGGITMSDDVQMEHVKILSDKSILIAGILDGGGGDVDPGPGVVNVNPSSGSKHIFMLKLDSSFNFIDVKIIESLDTLWLYTPLNLINFNVDEMGNIYVLGLYIGNVDFDPGPGQYLQNFLPPGGPPYDLYSQGMRFVLKLNSAMEFEKISMYSKDLQFSSVTDPINNFYLYGESKGNVDMDPGPGVTLVNNTTSNKVFYIAKYDSLYNFLWVKSTQNDIISPSTLRYGKNNSLNLVCYLIDTLGSNGFGIQQYGCNYSNGPIQYTFYINFDTSGIAKQCINLGISNSLGSTDCVYGSANNFYMSGRISEVTDIEAGPGITLMGAFPDSSYNFFLSYYSTDPYISQIRGNAFIDQNGNNIKDVNEGGAQGLIVAIDPGNYFVSTGSSGDFGTYLTPNNYNITIPTYPLYYLPPIPAVHSANFTTGNQLDTANNFAIQLDLSRQDLRVTLTNIAGTRPGFPLNYNLTVKNIGANAQSGSVTVDLDNKLTFLSASTGPDSLTGDTLTWNFVNLMPLQSLSYDLLTRVDSLAVLGNTVVSTTQVLPIIGDADTTNNLDESLSIITGSYDPNEKASKPSNAVPLSFVQNGQFIEYTIRFQNLGNDTAFNVIILDTLSSLLDIGSLEIVACSHDYYFNLYPSRLLEIRMENILLPDSGINEVKSNGFIKYKIRIKNNLNLGDIVNNTAHIYFDYNQPVATNTTALEVVQFTDLNEMVDATNEIIVYPNPSSGITTILFNNQDKISGKIEVIDISGRVVMNIPSFTGHKIQLNLNHLGSGIYLLKSELTTGKKYFAKIILTNEED